MAQLAVRKTLLRELGWFFGLFFIGLVVMPIAIYAIGLSLFGTYGGHGYGDFFGTLSGKVRSGDRIAWFLVLMPYLVFLALRLTRRGWHRTPRSET